MVVKLLLGINSALVITNIWLFRFNLQHHHSWIAVLALGATALATYSAIVNIQTLRMRAEIKRLQRERS